MVIALKCSDVLYVGLILNKFNESQHIIVEKKKENLLGNLVENEQNLNIVDGNFGQFQYVFPKYWDFRSCWEIDVSAFLLRLCQDSPCCESRLQSGYQFSECFVVLFGSVFDIACKWIL